ncbi:glycoside Hydrolase Family 25-like lysozyme/endolysin [Eubacterium sp. CAG:248]|nr:glycoside Hydrolase Family 25-like lysozyme/endolysin [Eubacterium sp. CAG:248]
MVRGKYKYKSILKMFFVIILSCIMAVTMNNAAMAVVIDVSGHDGLIDWDSAKEHIEGVIIRIGYGNDYAYQDDKQAVQNMDECERLGIPYGVYIYSYAMTMQETESEISHTLRMLKGRNPVRGVWFDMEDADEYKKNHGMDVYSEEDRTLLTDICIRFIDEMHSRGYITGVYANYDYYKNVLDTNRLSMTEGFNMWLAHWDVEEPDMDCMMWQFGAYRIGDHEFDGNIYYADYSSPYKDAYIETSARAGRKVNVIYQAQIDGNYWLPQVINDEDYAGIRGRNITGITLSTDIGYAVYRVYSNGRWLAYVDSRNSDISDYYNGYAGNGHSIEAVEVYYYTPDTLLYNEAPHYQAFTENGYKYAYYRVSTTGNDYFPYQTDNERNDGQDGYAGIYGRKVDRFQIVIK